jgi:hypothetical protein
VGVEKWAAQGRGGRVPDARFQERQRQPEPRGRLVSAALYTLAADRSEARSCAARELAVLAPQVERAQQDAAQPLKLEAPQKQQAQLVQGRMEEARDAPQERSPTARLQARVVSPLGQRSTASQAEVQLQPAPVELPEWQAAPRASQ